MESVIKLCLFAVLMFAFYVWPLIKKFMNGEQNEFANCDRRNPESISNAPIGGMQMSEADRRLAEARKRIAHHRSKKREEVLVEKTPVASKQINRKKRVESYEVKEVVDEQPVECSHEDFHNTDGLGKKSRKKSPLLGDLSNRSSWKRAIVLSEVLNSPRHSNPLF